MTTFGCLQAVSGELTRAYSTSVGGQGCSTLSTEFEAAEPLSSVKTVDRNRRNRHETRTITVFDATAAVAGTEWEPHVAAIIQVERDVNVRQADTGFWKPSLETSIYLSNRPVAAKIAADAIRQHWGIENKSHYDDIRRLRFRVIMHGANGDALTEKAPLYNLLKDLRAGRIVAIGGDDTDLPAEYWDRIGYGQPWQDWPHVRFRREHVLENWPKRSNQSERYPGRPTAEPAIFEKFCERVAAGTFEKRLAAELQWLFSWVKNEFPGDLTIPSTTRTNHRKPNSKRASAGSRRKT